MSGGVQQPAQVADGPRPLPADDTADRGDRARNAGYRHRFGVIYVVLALIAGLGVGALIVLLARPDSGPAPAWSAWEPTGSDVAKTRQIADHVGSSYRLADGEQMTVALSGPPTVTAGGTDSTGAIPVRAIAVRPDTSTGQAEDEDIDIVDAAGSHQYVLCGLGTNCSIASGEPSEERHALLRREAMELALYTFKYVDTIDSVTVFLPPRPGGDTAPTAVFLERGDVAKELDTSLRRTLEPTTPGVGQMRSAELTAVNRVTLPRLYDYEYTQAQDGSAVLVLSPLVTSG